MPSDWHRSRSRSSSRRASSSCAASACRRHDPTQPKGHRLATCVTFCLPGRDQTHQNGAYRAYHRCAKSGWGPGSAAGREEGAGALGGGQGSVGRQLAGSGEGKALRACHSGRLVQSWSRIGPMKVDIPNRFRGSTIRTRGLSVPLPAIGPG